MSQLYINMEHMAEIKKLREQYQKLCKFAFGSGILLGFIIGLLVV